MAYNTHSKICPGSISFYRYSTIRSVRIHRVYNNLQKIPTLTLEEEEYVWPSCCLFTGDILGLPRYILNFLHHRQPCPLCSKVGVKRKYIFLCVTYKLKLNPFNIANEKGFHPNKVLPTSDFTLDFEKLPFSLYLGKLFIHFGKIITKIHKVGKIKTIFGLGMTRIPNKKVKISK